MSRKIAINNDIKDPSLTPEGELLRFFGIFMGVITFMAAASLIIPEGIIGVLGRLLPGGDSSNISDLGKGMGNTIALLLIFLISYLLYAPDEFYRRHLRLITAGGAIAAAVGVGLFAAPYFYCQESSFGAALYALLLWAAGLLALADAAVLFIRRWKAQK